MCANMACETSFVFEVPAIKLEYCVFIIRSMACVLTGKAHTVHPLISASYVQKPFLAGQGQQKLPFLATFVDNNLYELLEMEIPLRMNIFPFLVIHKIARHHTLNHHHHQTPASCSASSLNWERKVSATNQLL